MTIVPCHLENSKQDALPTLLDCRDNWWHCAAVQPELHCTYLQAVIHNGFQVGVAL